MNKFIGHLKDVAATAEWVATRDVIPLPEHIYPLLLTGHGKRRWSVVYLLTDKDYREKDKRDWEDKAAGWHPQSIQGLWIHAPKGDKQ